MRKADKPPPTPQNQECFSAIEGEYLDNETGLYYLRARYYDPTLGRFISEDSYWGEDSNALSLNLYTYAFNDPIRFIDPTGHTSIGVGSSGDGVVAIQEMLDSLGYKTGGADGKFGKNTQAAVLQFQKDYGLQVDGKVGNQTLTYLKSMNAVKNAPDYARQSALESASKAKVGGIKDDTILMSTKTFEKAIENLSGVRKTTGGGSVQTSVQNNQVVITGVTIPTSNGEKKEVKAEKPIAAATATQDVARFEEKVSIVKEAVQPVTVNTGKSQGTGSPNLAMINRVDQGTSNDPYKLEYFEFEGLYRPTAFTEDYTRWDEIGDNLIMSLGLPIINKKIADSGVTPNGRVLTQNEKDALYEKDKENWIDTVLFLAFSGGKGKGELTPTKIFARPIAGDNTGIQLRIQPKEITRVRHYTNRKGINGIEQDGSIIAKDNNRVYVEPANKSPLSQVEAETKYQLKPGRGRDYVEFDAPNSLLEWVKNPRYGTPELTIKDGVNELKNPSFVRRK